MALGVTAAVVGAAAVTLRAARARHEREADRIWAELELRGGAETFDPASVDGLPEPARRYLLHAIAPGTPLARSVRLRMTGEMRMSPGAETIPMRAEQILAPPHGLVWRAEVGTGLQRFSGFDRYARGTGEMRWWLGGIVPIVSAGGPDVSRSAAGRVAGEGVLLPSALLPSRGARWEAVDDSTARVHLDVGGERVTMTLTLAPDGRPLRASLLRWKDDAGAGRPGYVRFMVDELADERTFGGYTVPTRFRAGWRLGDPDEFPFFYAVIEDARFQ